MSNKEILQQHNVRLNDNNTDLTSILETINNLPDKVYIKLQEKNVEPTTEQQEIVPDEGYTGLEKVTVAAIEENNLEIIPSTENQNFDGIYTNVSVAGDEDLLPENIKKGTSIFGVEGNADVADFKITNADYLFYNESRLEYMEELLNLCEKPTSLSRMFYGCKSKQEIDLSNLDTSEVTDMSYMLYQCTSLAKIDLSNFDTGNVINMGYMFFQCNKLTELDVSNWNTSKVTNMQYMFNICVLLDNLDLSGFDMGKVERVNNMFVNCPALQNLNFGTNLGKGYISKTNNSSNCKLDLSNCTKLTHDSLMSVINNLYDLNLTYNVANGGTLYTQKLVLGSTNLAKLTSEEIAIATNKRLVSKLIMHCINIQNMI